MDNQKELEKLIDELMVNDDLDSPSADFTKKVMTNLPVERNLHFVYKPLLPKSVLAVVTLLILTLIAVVVSLYGISDVNPRYLRGIGEVGSKITDVFAQIKFSKTVTYIIFFAGLMFCVQTLVLKKHFDSRAI